MSWADIAALDNSRDGLNLMIKTSMKMGQGQDESKSDMPTTKGSKENLFFKRMRAEGLLPEQKKKNKDQEKGCWKSALLEKLPELEPMMGTNSNRKRLACDITKTPAKPKKNTNSAKKDDSQNHKHRRTRTMSRTKDKNLGAPVGENDIELSPCKLDFSKVDDVEEEKVEKREEEVMKRRIEPEQVVAKMAFKPIKSWADDADGIDSGDSNDESDKQSNDGESPSKRVLEELTESRIEKRQKQIDYGKATEGYQNYITKVKKENRGENPRKYPVTPDKNEHISKRSWDYKVRQWRRRLHHWDTPESEAIKVNDPAEFPSLEEKK